MGSERPVARRAPPKPEDFASCLSARFLILADIRKTFSQGLGKQPSN